MSLLSTIGRFASEYRAARAELRTMRMISALPTEIRKDIGWPDAFESRHHNIGVGTWAGSK